jgi:hypothetical protein
MKVLVSRFVMIILWTATVVLSLYMTFYRGNLTQQEILFTFGSLVTLGILSVLFSYVYLKFLSPISSVRDNIEEYVEENSDETEE